jgi:prephenate dehydrogenase
LKLSEAKIGIIGMGQMGGSLGKALVRQRLVQSVVAFVRTKEKAKKILKEKAAHKVIVGEKKFFSEKVDILIFAVPINVIVKLIQRIPSKGWKDTLFMDLGSIKKKIFETAERKKIAFLSGHPMAGSEKSGIEASQSNLFYGKPFLLIKGKNLPLKKAKLGEALIKGVGGIPIYMKNAEEHDQAVAVVSHLPHVMACALTHLVQKISSKKRFNRQPDFLWKIAGPSLHDTTRVAGSNPEIVFDFLWGNKRALQKFLPKLQQEFSYVWAWLQSDQEEKLKAWIAKAKKIKNNL